MTSPNFALALKGRQSRTPMAEVDRTVDRVAAQAERWIRTPIERRVELLRHCIRHTLGCSKEWVEQACKAKGLDPEGPRAGEEWLGGPMTLIRNLRLLAEALREGAAPSPVEIRTTGRQVIAKVAPRGAFEGILYPGLTAEVWIQPGEKATQGRIYRDKKDGVTRPGRVSLVLGAGNVASIGPMDALTKLFQEDEVVVIKTNPVNAYLEPFWKEALEPLVEEGFVGIVRGGAQVGQHLVHHPKIDTIHMTGSDRTFDAIVWGTTQPEELARRKEAGEKAVDKPVTAELGCVTPILVVPGNWSDKQLRFQARHIASMVTNNASFNCTAGKVLVLSAGWSQRETLLQLVQAELSATPPRRAYYPGAQERYDGFLERYPQARALGPRSKTVVPWTLIPDVPAEAGEYALSEEAFCGVLAQVTIPATHAKRFLPEMVELANESIWGTLSCTILIDPATKRAHAEEFQAALGDLRYGAIGVNCWSSVVYGLVSTTWGAYPGHTDEDIRSGRGVVHNTMLFDHPEKSVVETPFVPPSIPGRGPITPAWFADHTRLRELGEAITRFEANPSTLNLPRVLAPGLLG
jgi:acyl-CoA reductase-like NAD-dependent aldehyde dehydrogenase